MCKKYAPAVASRMHYGDDYLSALKSARWIVASDKAAVPFIREYTHHRHIVPWTPSINSVAADRKRGAGEKPRNVLAITRLTEHKNWPHVLEAISAVYCTATIITSFDADRMRRMVSRAGLAGRMKILDRPDEAEKFRLLWSSPVFLSASQYEGLGLPQMEAMYCGSRPVVYDFPVMREICGDVALYARWRDVGSLTDKLRQALESPERGRVKEAGQRYRFGQMLKRAPSWILP
jgi:glycosyltransferase involved in cell wall biosynthesis